MAKNNTLTLLSLSALALPCVTNSNPAQGAEPIESIQLSISQSEYSEDNLDEDLLFSGSAERYEIEVSQFSILAPIGEDLEIGADFIFDKMSGASPWYVADFGETLQAMSGASIKEERKGLSVNVSKYFDKASVSAAIFRSKENDYDGRGISLSASFDTHQQLTNWSIGWNYTNDKISASDADIFTMRPESEKRYSSEWVVGVTRVLDVNSIAQVGVGYKTHWGYLSDPYKAVFVGFDILPDTRPTARHASYLNASYKRHVRNVNGTVSIAYRYFSDNWGIDSETVDLSWRQNIGEHWAITPSIRNYHQASARFYQPTFDEATPDGYVSNDFRLSDFNSNSYGIELQYFNKQWETSFYIERYNSGHNNILSNGENNAPGLVNFDLISLGVKYSL